MKQLWKFLKSNKDVVGFIMHIAWLGINIWFKDLTNTDHVAGHGIIGGITGVGIWERGSRNKEKVNNAIRKGTQIFKKNTKKQNRD